MIEDDKKYISNLENELNTIKSQYNETKISLSKDDELIDTLQHQIATISAVVYIYYYYY